MEDKTNRIVLNAAHGAIQRLQIEHDAELNKYWAGDPAAGEHVIFIKHQLDNVREGYFGLIRGKRLRQKQTAFK